MNKFKLTIGSFISGATALVGYLAKTCRIEQWQYEYDPSLMNPMGKHWFTTGTKTIYPLEDLGNILLIVSVIIFCATLIKSKYRIKIKLFRGVDKK